jgi:hypothetical protein
MNNNLPTIHYYHPKSQQEFSLWFVGKINPVHKGIYDVVWFDQVTCSGSLEWNGKQWQHLAWLSKQSRPIVKKIEFWRGLKKMTKGKQS